MGHTLTIVSVLENDVAKGKITHIWKNGSHRKKQVTLVKIGPQCELVWDFS